MTPRGLRNFNPGNIESNSFTSTWTGYVGSDGRFCKFNTMANGLRAIAHLLLIYQTQYGINTIRAVINRWAPPVENETSAYVTAVSSDTGYDPDTPLDFRDPSVLRSLVVAIGRHENGREQFNHYVTTQELDAAVAAELNIREVDVRVEPTPAPTNEPSFVEEKPMLPAIVTTLISIFAPLLQQKLSSVLSKVSNDKVVTAQIEQQLLGLAQQVTGAPTSLEAVAALVADKRAMSASSVPVAAEQPSPGQLVQKMEQATSEWLDQIAPLLDKAHQYQKDEWAAEEESRDRASKRDADLNSKDMGRPLLWWMIGLSSYLAVFLTVIAGYQAMFRDAISSEVWAAVVGTWSFVAGVSVTMVTFRYGASRESDAKTATLSQIAISRR